MRMDGGSGCKDLVFLTSALVGGQRSASSPCRFNRGKRVTSTHWLESWVGPVADVDEYGEIKMFYPTGTQTSDPSIVQLVSISYTDCATAAQ
jgi:hypothetical protein